MIPNKKEKQVKQEKVDDINVTSDFIKDLSERFDQNNNSNERRIQNLKNRFRIKQ